MQANEQVSLYLKSTGYFKFHYSQHNVWCQLCQIYDSMLHFSGGSLYMCVYVYNIYGRCWLMTERKSWNFAEALRNTPKENPISDLQSKKLNRIVTVWGRQRLQSGFFLSSRLKEFRTSLERFRHAAVRQLTSIGRYKGMRLCNHVFFKVGFQQVWHWI